MKENNRKIRPQIFISLAIVTPLGFICKLYRGPGYGWFNDYGGGILYEIFWCLAFFLIWPRKSAILPICAGVFIGTTLLELLQLFSHPTLEYIRSGFIGRTLIGSSFSFLDIPHYLVGCIIAWGLMRAISRVYFGSASDSPQPGIYTGDGTADIGIYRPASGRSGE